MFVIPPVEYISDFIIPLNDIEVDSLWDSLPLKQYGLTPRYECWMNDDNANYTYGSGKFSRTYEPSEWNAYVDFLRCLINDKYKTSFNCCFINGYPNEKNHLGWHSDDSPEMDNNHPIAIISFGAEREIWFKSNEYNDSEVVKIRLENSSFLLMEKGMQKYWKHRIPKNDRPCGKRISLTFRRIICTN